MAEENKEYIEELLSNYIDDELTDRERNEVKRLIAHDVDVKRKFEQLRKIKVLLNLAPTSPAPDYIFENVKAQIERKVLLGEYQYSQQKQVDVGRKYLVVRRIMTAAAMLALIAALAWVIMDIVMPPSDSAAPVAINRLKAEKKVLYEKPAFANQAIKRTIPFYARLELTTTKAATIDKFISKIILNSDMFDMITSTDRQPNSIRYSINCPKQDITKLLLQMAPAWKQCENVQLSVPGETINSFVTIDKVSISQVMDVFNVDQPQRRTETVKEMAVLNQMIQSGEYQKSFAFDMSTASSLFSPSKPVLTTARRQNSHPLKSQTAEPVNLTIIVH